MNLNLLLAQGFDPDYSPFTWLGNSLIISSIILAFAAVACVWLMTRNQN